MDGIVNDAFGKSNDYDIPGSFSGLGMRRVVLSILASVSLALSVAVVVIALRPRRVGWVPIGPVTLVPDRYDLIFYWRHREVMWVDYWALSLTLGAVAVLGFFLVRRWRDSTERGFPVDCDGIARK